MANRTHLFLAANAAGFGEINVGLRVARDLHAAGDGVIFLAPRAAAVLVEGTPFRHEPIDEAFWTLEDRVSSLVRREHCATLVLLDVTSVLLALHTLCVDTGFLERLDLPVVALDFWNLPEAGPEWDLGTESWAIPPEALRIPRRLIPAPIARPTTPGAFGAFPSVPALSDAERRSLREELGVPEDGKLLLFTSSRFQLPELQARKHGQRLARMLPVRAAGLLGRLGPLLHVVHVGPAALEAWSALGSRYRWIGQVSASRFQALLRSADLLLSFNTTASTTISAVAAGLPVVAGMNSRAGRSADEVAASLRRPPSEELRRWLEEVVPLHPFHIWGLGLYHFLSPVLEDNPYTTAFRSVEVLDEEELEEACHALLFDPAARAREEERQAAYREAVAGLPSAGEAFRACL